MMRRASRSGRRRRGGLVMVIVLVTIALLALAGYGFSGMMRSEYAGVRARGQMIRAQQLAASGVEAAKALLTLTPEEIEDYGGLFDNPARFQGLLVTDGEDPRDRGRVTLAAPMLDGDGYATGAIRYGLEDESGRINLNLVLLADESVPGAGREILMALPGMTEDVADGILDWMDEDDEPREYGAEASYYAGLDPPYAPANGPIESIEELLMVAGVTPWLLLGDDAARSFGAQAATGPTGSNSNVRTTNTSIGSASQTTGDGWQTTGSPGGWSEYFTIHSAEVNLNSEGLARIDVNGSDMEALYDELSAALGTEWATFIVAYRQNGPYNSSSNNASGGAGGSGGGTTGGGSGGGGGGGSIGGDFVQATQTQAAGAGVTEVQAVQAEQAEQAGSGGGGGQQVQAQGATQGQSSQAGTTSGGTTQQNSSNVSDDPNDGESIGGRQLDLTQGSSTELTSILDLIDARVQVQFSGEEEPVVLKALFPNNPIAMQLYLPKLSDAIGVNPSEVLPGRININQAPRAVLAAIPGMDDALVDAILSERISEPAVGDQSRAHETWLLSEGLATLDQMKQILPFVTVKGSVYRVHSVGFFDGGGPSARVEAVIDATGAAPQVVSWRELTHLGRGFSLGTLGAAAQ